MLHYCLIYLLDILGATFMGVFFLLQIIGQSVALLVWYDLYRAVEDIRPTFSNTIVIRYSMSWYGRINPNFETESLLQSPTSQLSSDKVAVISEFKHQALFISPAFKVVLKSLKTGTIGLFIAQDKTNTRWSNRQ